MGTRGVNPRASHRNGRVLRGSAGRAAKIGFGTEDFRLNCRVFYHDHCFDGACSASLFTRFHRERIGTAQEFSYHGLMHQAAGSLFDESAFIEGENAIVDFKYSASPKVTWWFDHHQSAFLTADDRRDFLAWQAQANSPKVLAVRKPSDGGKFYDPAYISCTSLIADVARERFGFDTAPLAELIHWANIVDGAKYESAECGGGDGRAGDEADAGDRKLRRGICAARDSPADRDGAAGRCSTSPSSRPSLGR